MTNQHTNGPIVAIDVSCGLVVCADGRRWVGRSRVGVSCTRLALPGGGGQERERSREGERERTSEHERDLNQDFQEQKCSSAALVPLEIPSKPWPCTFLMLPTLRRCEK
jgi:hypothetical protein